ncbi:bromodomain associated domain-containing protein [Arthroderma uncinatum]|uniref:bromodomain associated domain-containing protein n=1 Tax=Arthroderma uncinatum TaxID=74035 RepID=UPI00144AC568|nr:bromodomain associated domain-containing protein [Arthroderma uncinatum]KAF3482639.1 bromodomain associated domain-containing protein [Arthroderma uncinatum]
MALTNSTQAPPSPQNSAKRPSSDIECASPAKKQRQSYRRHHRLREFAEFGGPGAEILNDSKSIDTQLNASIGRVLGEVGFDGIEPVVLDSFRNNVEERTIYRLLFQLIIYVDVRFVDQKKMIALDMLHFLSYVRHSMTSSRRVQPIPQDFEHALRYHSIRVDSLRPHLKAFPHTIQSSPSTPTTKSSLLTPPPEDDDDEPIPARNFAFLGPELNVTNDDSKRTSYIPKNFPRFPSKHTYQETPVYATKREMNPEKIRERATEEGRLGEEALRKLTRAARDGQASTRGQRERSLWGRKNESMDSMFEKTLKALMKSSSAGSGKQGDIASTLGLGPIVNSSRVYWRKMSTPSARSDSQRTTDWIKGGTAEVE